MPPRRRTAGGRPGRRTPGRPRTTAGTSAAPSRTSRSVTATDEGEHRPRELQQRVQQRAARTSRSSAPRPSRPSRPAPARRSGSGSATSRPSSPRARARSSAPSPRHAARPAASTGTPRNVTSRPAPSDSIVTANVNSRTPIGRSEQHVAELAPVRASKRRAQPGGHTMPVACSPRPASPYARRDRPCALRVPGAPPCPRLRGHRLSPVGLLVRHLPSAPGRTARTPRTGHSRRHPYRTASCRGVVPDSSRTGVGGRGDRRGQPPVESPRRSAAHRRPAGLTRPRHLRGSCRRASPWTVTGPRQARSRQGSSAVTVVGPPTGESTTNSPSTASSRSASPAMPEPPASRRAAAAVVAHLDQQPVRPSATRPRRR